jgi:Peptidase family M28
MVPVSAGAMGVALAVCAFIWRTGATSRGPVLALMGLGCVIGAASVRAARVWVLSCPVARHRSVNLVARRGNPSLWLVAHLDTKSQPMPTLVRASLLVSLGLSVILSTIVGVLLPQTQGASWILPALGAAAGLLLTFATVGNASPGAVDNASGVAALLTVIDNLDPGKSLGVLLSSAEEHGLAGVRAWTRGRRAGRAINLDTLDDGGEIRCMVHGSSGGELASAVRAAAGVEGASVRVGRLLPGLLTDGVALADAGWQCVTVSRGTLATLARIHRPTDTVGRLTGEGAEGIARILGRLVAHEG